MFLSNYYLITTYAKLVSCKYYILSYLILRKLLSMFIEIKLYKIIMYL